jgi:translation initiation factor IF-3
LIDPDGNQLGVKPLHEAMSIARQLDLDLVEVAAEANPPVCRIMDFNRFKYEAAQRAKESRRKTTSTSIKEMKYRPKIGTGDFDTKTRQVARFLGDGHKVKITIMFRGREMSHPELGKKILDHVAETVGDVAKVEAAPKLDGRNMIMVLAPDRRAQQAAAKAGHDEVRAPAAAVVATNGSAVSPASAPVATATPEPAASSDPAVASDPAVSSEPAVASEPAAAPASAAAPAPVAAAAPEPAAVPVSAAAESAPTSLAPEPVAPAAKTASSPPR